MPGYAATKAIVLAGVVGEAGGGDSEVGGMAKGTQWPLLAHPPAQRHRGAASPPCTVVVATPGGRTAVVATAAADHTTTVGAVAMPATVDWVRRGSGRQRASSVQRR